MPHSKLQLTRLALVVVLDGISNRSPEWRQSKAFQTWAPLTGLPVSQLLIMTPDEARTALDAMQSLAADEARGHRHDR